MSSQRHSCWQRSTWHGGVAGAWSEQQQAAQAASPWWRASGRQVEPAFLRKFRGSLGYFTFWAIFGHFEMMLLTHTALQSVAAAGCASFLVKLPFSPQWYLILEPLAGRKTAGGHNPRTPRGETPQGGKQHNTRREQHTGKPTRQHTPRRESSKRGPRRNVAVERAWDSRVKKHRRSVVHRVHPPLQAPEKASQRGNTLLTPRWKPSRGLPRNRARRRRGGRQGLLRRRSLRPRGRRRRCRRSRRRWRRSRRRRS